MKINEKIFKDYYIGRKGLYHNKNVVILSANYDQYEYIDFGFEFEKLEILLFYEDGTKTTRKIRGNQIKLLKLYDN